MRCNLRQLRQAMAGLSDWWRILLTVVASTIIDPTLDRRPIPTSADKLPCIRAEGDIGPGGDFDSGGSGGSGGGGGGGGGGDGYITEWGDLSLPGWIEDLKLLYNNPRGFVLGVLLSTLVGYVLQALLLGLNLGRWLAGFEVPGQITVDGSSVNVPWCSSNECDLFSFVDFPGFLTDKTIESLGLGGFELLRGFETIWTSLPSDNGLVSVVILFLIGVALVVGLYWLIRLIIALLPVSRP